MGSGTTDHVSDLICLVEHHFKVSSFKNSYSKTGELKCIIAHYAMYVLNDVLDLIYIVIKCNILTNFEF